jgi:hypothetical protein
MLIATEFTILRGIVASGLISHDVPKRPIRVATMIDEKAFVESGHKLVHNETVFLEDFVHDWNWSAGKFRYYTRISESSDVLLIYAEQELIPAEKSTSFCGQCGKPLNRPPSPEPCDACKKG